MKANDFELNCSKRSQNYCLLNEASKAERALILLTCVGSTGNMIRVSFANPKHGECRTCCRNWKERKTQSLLNTYMKVSNMIYVGELTGSMEKFKNP
jgi:hypothetical protein